MGLTTVEVRRILSIGKKVDIKAEVLVNDCFVLNYRRYFLLLRCPNHFWFPTGIGIFVDFALLMKKKPFLFPDFDTGTPKIENGPVMSVFIKN